MMLMRRVGCLLDIKRSPLVKGRNRTIAEDELGVARLLVQAVCPCGYDTIPTVNRCW